MPASKIPKIVLGPFSHACSRGRNPTEQEAHGTDLRECVDERGSERADSKGQGRGWEEPAGTHLLAQDIQGNLEYDVRDIEHAQDSVVVCAAVSVDPSVSERS